MNNPSIESEASCAGESMDGHEQSLKTGHRNKREVGGTSPPCLCLLYAGMIVEVSMRVKCDARKSCTMRRM